MPAKVKSIWNKIRPSGKTFKQHSTPKKASPIQVHSGYGMRGGSKGSRLS